MTKEEASQFPFDKRGSTSLLLTKEERNPPAAMPPKDKKNCKGLPAGTGTVSNTRRQQFKDKGKRRELANMEACDKKLNDGQWQSFYKLEKNRKARKLTEEEVNFFLLSPEEKEKYLAKKKQVEEEAKKGQLAKEEESTFDKRVDAASGFKSEVAGSVDKTLPSSSKGVKEEILTPALADWENVKKKLLEKKLEKEREEEEKEKAREARTAAGTESPPDWGNMSSSSSTSSSSSSNKAGGEASFDKREAKGTPAQAAQGSFDKREPQASQSSGALDKKAPMEPPHVPGQEVKKSSLEPNNKLELARHINNIARGSSGRVVWTRKKKVAVDWYQTTRLKEGGVPRGHIEALQKLRLCGWEVTLLSFCKSKREEEVRGELYDLRHEFAFDFVCFTRSKCGYNGKFQTCKRLGIKYLIDDDESILRESSQGGMWVYPIQTHYLGAGGHTEACHWQWTSWSKMSTEIFDKRISCP